MALVIAGLPLPGLDGRLWMGWPSLCKVMAATRQFAGVIMHAHVTFSNEVKTLMQTPLDFDNVRVPCDVRRVGVRNLGWTP